MKKTDPTTRNLALIIIFIYIIFAWAFAPLNFREQRTRLRVSQVQADERKISFALETYSADHADFPPERPLADFASRRSIESAGGTRLFSIAPGPVAEVAAGLTDPFAPGHPPFAYFRYPATASTPAGWILFSTGPDRKYELTRADYTPGTPPTLAIIAKTYDPTNGTTSTGDVWRINDAAASTSPATAALPRVESPSPVAAQNN